MSSSSGTLKRKHVSVSIATKIEVAKKRRSGYSLEDLARQYGVGKSTISEWSTKLETLQEQANGGLGDRVRVRGCACLLATLIILSGGKHPMLDRLIHDWITRARAANKVVTIAVLQEKAMKFAKELIEKAADKDAPEMKALKDFTSSNHWVEG